MMAIVLANFVGTTPDSALIRDQGLFAGWTLTSWIPVVSNAVGGILVGLVTKYSGGVRKGCVGRACLAFARLGEL